MSTNRPSFVAADQVASLTRRATEERVVYMYVGRLVAGQFILGQFECCESSFRLTATEKCCECQIMTVMTAYCPTAVIGRCFHGKKPGMGCDVACRKNDICFPRSCHHADLTLSLIINRIP